MMLTEKINKLQRETDFAERKLVQNLNQIEGKVVLKNIFESLIPTASTTSLDANISALSNVTSLKPIVQKGKVLFSIYKKFLMIKRFYNLFKKV